MAGAANVAVVEFSHARRRHLRVYYQFSDEQCIRESCYWENYGWFMRGDGIVTRQAKAGSLIAATHWHERPENKVKIGVFYFDNKSQLLWSQADQEISTAWTSSTIGDTLGIEFEPTSGLSVSQSEDKTDPIRLFFQQNTRSDRAPLRELRYDFTQQTWKLVNGDIASDALKGTRLAVACDGETKAVRLYYQGADLALHEMYCNPTYKWGRKVRVVYNNLIPKAPISAVCWDSGEPIPVLRIFTVVGPTGRSISQLSYTDSDGWKAEKLDRPGYRPGSVFAACRGPLADVTIHSPIHFVYQSAGHAVGMMLMPADESPGSKLLVSKVEPLATIPISMDGPLAADGTREEESENRGNSSTQAEIIAALKKDLETARAETDRLRSENADLLTKLEATKNNSNGADTDPGPKGDEKWSNDELHRFFHNRSSGNVLTTPLDPRDTLYVTQSLKKSGFDANGQDLTRSGRVALIEMIKQHNNMGATYLLSRKSTDLDAVDGNGDTALFAACNANEYEIVCILRNMGAYVKCVNADGDTPLHIMARQGNTGIAYELLFRYPTNADPNAKNHKGETPLHVAEARGMIERLREAGANMNELDGQGLAPIHRAVLSRPNIVPALLDNAAWINSYSTQGFTALFYAISVGSESLVRLLLERGADRNKKSENEGQTPLEFAKQRNYPSIIKLLESK